MKREILVIALLVVLALSVPALILYNGLADRAEREWLERPYEGTLAEFLQEHIELMNEAVGVFAAKPELFEQYFDWSGDTRADISRFDVWQGWLPHAMLTEAEWAMVQQLFAAQRCTGVYYMRGIYSMRHGWLEIPIFRFAVRTTEGDRQMLLWLPEAGDPETAARALETLREDYAIRKTAYPEWYAAEYRERSD